MALRQIPPERLAGGAGEDGRGLSEAEAAARLARYGANDILTAPPSTWLTLARDTLGDPMLWFLLGMSGLFVATGDRIEAAVLAAALIPLMGMDAFLHRRTQTSTRSLATRLAAQALVIRDGAARTIPARELAPGDLVEVAAGAPFPADGVIVGGEGLQADESSLTGEAWPARKCAPAEPLASLAAAESEAWAFAGTRLLTGPARLRIVFTGGETLYGEIVRSAVIGSHAKTPLQKAVSRLVALMLVASVALCLALAAIRLIEGHGLFDAFVSAATLAIAALPEEFPVVFTFFLGVGVYRLARRQALVRRAVAVENIGRVSCICSDKTGTLTEGVLTLAHVSAADGVDETAVRAWAALAARADSGDPLDAALIAAAPDAAAAGVRLATFPFTEDRRRETALFAGLGPPRLAILKGAPETVFARCTLSTAEREGLGAEAEALAAQGHKVIALATQALAQSAPLDVEPEGGFDLAGLLALEDPVREGVREAVEACAGAGIRVIMVTGDHPATARAIAAEAGLGGAQPVVVLADDLDGEGAPIAVAALAGVDVIARAAPGQKLRLVQALQRAGEVVAVTGDGVNDVPALQTADVGVAMGERGAQSAREVAAIVLLDDNFRTIVRAIGEGRQLFGNLQLSFAYILMVHIPLVLTAALIPLAGHPLLYLPVHVVWLELIIHPTALLVFQELPTSEHLPPRRRHASARFFGPRSWAAIVISGLMLAALIDIAFERALAGGSVEHARSAALAALIAAGAASTAVLSGLRSRSAWVMVVGALASVALLVQVPALAALVQLAPLHGHDWSLALVAGILAAGLSLAVKASLRETPRPAAG